MDSPTDRKTILLVDDAPIVAQALMAVLTRKGFHVFHAPGGREALDLLDTHTPDLVLLDLFMPGMDGLTLLRTLRADPRFQDLPVIALSATRTEDIQAQLAALDVDTCVCKDESLFPNLLKAFNQILGGPALATAAA